MKSIPKLLASISLRQRIALIAVGVAIAAAAIVFALRSGSGDYQPLYTGVAQEDAGAVLQKLREKGVQYRVRDHDGAILVPSAKVAETRLEMAAAGLPKSGRLGFELFDRTKFGASDLTERVNLRRAVEGELERSVSALSEVDSARVHVTYPKESVFAENRLPAKASVMVRLKTGRALDEQSVAAVRFLVASAVEGLAPEAVSVVDMDGRVLGKPKERSPNDPSVASDAALEYRLRIEKEMLQRMNETLEAIVGPERYRASVFVECDLTRGEQSEESFDPAKSVMTASERVKESSSATTPAGVPGTASNLPRPVGPQSRGNGYTRESENVTYQSAHTIKRIRLPEGRIVRISASVLVDQDLQWTRQGDGYRRVLTPPSADMLRRLRELVSGAIGVDETRGDRLVIDSLPFDSTLKRQPPEVVKPPVSPWDRVRQQSPRLWIPVIAGAAVLLAVVVFLMMRRKKKSAPETLPAIAAPLETDSPSFDSALPAPADSELDEAANDLKRRIEGTRRKRALEKQQLQAAGALAEEVLQELRDSASVDPGLCAGALRIWLTEAEPVRVERHGK